MAHRWCVNLVVSPSGLNSNWLPSNSCSSIYAVKRWFSQVQGGDAGPISRCHPWTKIELQQILTHLLPFSSRDRFIAICKITIGDA
jgi:hypothetical protein